MLQQLARVDAWLARIGRDLQVGIAGIAECEQEPQLHVHCFCRAMVHSPMH